MAAASTGPWGREQRRGGGPGRTQAGVEGAWKVWSLRGFGENQPQGRPDVHARKATALLSTPNRWLTDVPSLWQLWSLLEPSGLRVCGRDSGIAPQLGEEREGPFTPGAPPEWWP